MAVSESVMPALQQIDMYGLPLRLYRAEIKRRKSVDKQYGQAGMYLAYTVVLIFFNSSCPFCVLKKTS